MKTILLTALLLFLPGTGRAELTGEVCGSDLDGDGVYDGSGEISRCLDGVCPHETAACEPSYAEPSCAAPGRLDPGRDMCRAEPLSIACPAGYEYDPSLDRCVQAVRCAEGGVFNPATDLCEKLPLHECPAGYVYDEGRDLCTRAVGCGGGSAFVAARDRCEKTPVSACPEGYSLNAGGDRCESAPGCGAGSYSAARDLCLAPFTRGCPSGYAYVAGRDRCERNPVCAGGTYDPAANRCLVETTTTYGASYRTCTVSSRYDWNGGWMDPCSGEYSGSCSAPPGGSCTAFRDPLLCGKDTFSFDEECAIIAGDPAAGTIPIGRTVWLGVSQYVRNTTSTAASNLTCPAGGTLSGTNCAVETTGFANPTCPGGTMDYGRDLCFAPHVQACPAGTVYSAALGTCTQAASCSSGGRLDPGLDRCLLAAAEDCGEYAFDPALRVCHSPPLCLNGAYDAAADECLAAAAVSSECGAYLWNGATGKCESAPGCGTPGRFSATVDLCGAEAVHDCPAGYAWRGLPAAGCETAAVCGSGTYDPAADGCYLGDHSCPLGDYRCVDVDGDRRHECSALPCVDLAATPPVETPRDTAAYQDDGPVDPATGECSGFFKVFNGKGRECLPSGVSTSFFDCCDLDAGSFLFLREACPEESARTVQGVQAGQAHLVGEYCKKEIELIGCIQRARMFCTFNSKMGRLVQEQGRPQLRRFAPEGRWGTAEAPNCEGFTPEEFQMLDFSRIDLSELFGDLEPADAAAIQTDVRERVDEFQHQIR